MYDDLLNIDLGHNYSGDSLALLVAFVDDTAIIATGRLGYTQFLEETINSALKAVASWMEGNGFKLSPNKTEAVMLTSKRGYVVLCFTLNGVRLDPKEHLR